MFKGDSNLPADHEAASTWKGLGIPQNKIAYLGKDDNWWSAGDQGPCGSDTEVFIDTKPHLPVKDGINPGNDPDKRFVEIWNTVFMSYNRQGAELKLLPTRNIDQGAGLERLVSTLNNTHIYDTSCFKNVYKLLEAGITKQMPEDAKVKALRTVCDHLRSSLFIMSEEPYIYPSNKQQGAVLKRLIRNTVQEGYKLGLGQEDYKAALQLFKDENKQHNPEVSSHFESSYQRFSAESAKALKIIEQAPKHWTKATAKYPHQVPAQIVFNLKTTHGLPFDLLEHLAQETGKSFNIAEVQSLFKDHQQISK